MSARTLDGPADGSAWIVLGSANGSANLGDEAMWEAAVIVLREIMGPVPVITDAASDWTPSLDSVTVLPHLHLTLRRAWRFRELWKRCPQLRLLERVISRPRRNAYASRTARRALHRPRGRLQRQWREAVDRSAGVIVAGAGAINDDYAPHGIAAWGLLCAWAAEAGKPFALVGQGIGPLEEPVNRLDASALLRRAGVISVREEFSREVAVSMGVEADKVAVSMDWALLVSPGADDRVAARKLLRDLTGDQPFIAVSLHRRHSTTEEAMRLLSSTFEELAVGAAATGRRILFVPSMTAGGYSDDRTTAHRLMRGWSESNRSLVAVLDTRPSPKVTRAVLQLAVGLVTTRYHPMVFALAEGTPCVGISHDAYYDQKLVGLSALFSVEDNVHSLGSAELEPSAVFAGLEKQSVHAMDADSLSRIRAPLVRFLTGG